MTLYTKCILAPLSRDDGLRISIMSRHTLSDGATPDKRIKKWSFDLHETDLAPPPQLLGDYYNRQLPWHVFERRFMDFLQGEKQHKALRAIVSLSRTQIVTLNCIEDTPEH
mgnify:CR=1 FL=1